MVNKTEEQKILQFLKTDIRLYEASLFDLAFIQQHGLNMELLLAYAYHQDNQVAFRAAWLMEHAVLKEPACLVPIYNEFMDKLPAQKNWSCIRSFTKIGMLVTKVPGAVVEPEVMHENVWIEQSFNWIIDPSCPVAVLVNCLDILYYTSLRQEWIKEELAAQIQHLLKTPTPALVSRAKRILKRIL